MDNILKDSFLALVRMGIRHETFQDQGFMFQEPLDWLAVQALASHQGLSAIVVDGIERLPDNVRPPKELLLQWIGTLMQEESSYAIQWRSAVEMALLMKQKGISTYVLKGTVVAECYPKPNHRRSVDLDCFLRSEDGCADVWEEGNKIIEGQRYEVRRDFYKNSTFLLPGLTVENHRYLTPFRGNKRLMALERLLQKMLVEDKGVDKFEGTALFRPPIMASALFLIEHAYSHFLHEGLNWRHVLDWMLFYKRHKDEIDSAQLEKWIDEFSFRKFYDSYWRLGQYLLGEVPEDALTKADRMMLDDVWSDLDLHETVNGIRGKLALVGNTWRARWKYQEFTNITWVQALWIQVKGVLFDKEPKLQ